MLFGEAKLLDVVIGFILLGIGLLYLQSQDQSLNHLITLVNDQVLEQDVLYQQYSDNDICRISNDELYAIVIGYREYPIVIDGVIIATNETEFVKYLSLIKEGYYIKSYQCDTYNEIEQIEFHYFEGF